MACCQQGDGTRLNMYDVQSASCRLAHLHSARSCNFPGRSAADDCCTCYFLVISLSQHTSQATRQ